MSILRTTLSSAVLALALSASLAHAQVTTLAQQEAIWDQLLTAAKADPSTLIANVRSLVPQYGNYCGLQTAAPGALPIDCVDGACFQHDASPAYSTPNPTLAQIGQADQQFIANLSQVTGSTPYGELYRNAAMQLFQVKITYEQANDVSLIAPCADCVNTR